MRMPLYVLGFGFALSVVLVTAQTPQQQQAPPTSPGTPASRIGANTQSKPESTVPPSATAPSTTGGVSGSASSSTGQVPDVQNSSSVSAMADPNLESKIQNALSKEPTLTSDSAHVTVSGDTIELAGTVGTNKEKITATRIVQSYAGSMRLVNRLTVGRAGEKAPPQAPATDKADGGRQPDTADPTNNPEPGKSSSPSPSRPPQR